MIESLSSIEVVKARGQEVHCDKYDESDMSLKLLQQARLDTLDLEISVKLERARLDVFREELPHAA